MEALGNFCHCRPPLSCSVRSYSQLSTSTWPDYKGAHSPGGWDKYRRYLMPTSNSAATHRREYTASFRHGHAALSPARSSTAIRPTRRREKMSPDLVQQHLQFGGEEQDCLTHPSLASAGRSGPAGRNWSRSEPHRGGHLSTVAKYRAIQKRGGRRSNATWAVTTGASLS
jgi:hypothetical protein